MRAELDAGGEGLGVGRAAARVLCPLCRVRVRGEAAELVDVVDAEGDEAEQGREREEEDGPGDGAGGRDAKGALLVEAVFFFFWWV